MQLNCIIFVTKKYLKDILDSLDCAIILMKE